MKLDREKQISYDIAYMGESKKKGTNELIYKMEIEHVENKLKVTWSWVGEEVNWKTETDDTDDSIWDR